MNQNDLMVKYQQLLVNVLSPILTNNETIYGQQIFVGIFLMTMFLFCLFKFSIFPHKNEVQLYGICKEKFKIPKHLDF